MNSIFSAFTKVTFALLVYSSSCWAYYEVLDNAEVLPRGTFKLTGATQALTQGGGVNMTGVFDTGIQEDFGARALFGFGKTDFYLGGMVKWVPFPDIDRQPAIGFNAGLIYAKWMDAREYTWRFEPLISKKFSVDSAQVTPYASLPIGIRIRNSQLENVDNTTQMSWQLALGSQLQLERWKNLQFIAEIGLDLDHSLAYIVGGAIFYFDTDHGFQMK